MNSIYVFCALLLVVTAGFIEAQAYLHSVKAFSPLSSLDAAFDRLTLSLGLYVVGVLLDFCALFIMSRVRGFDPEFIALTFLAATCVGIALLSGAWLTWPMHRQLLSVFVTFSLLYLSTPPEKG